MENEIVLVRESIFENFWAIVERIKIVEKNPTPLIEESFYFEVKLSYKTKLNDEKILVGYWKEEPEFFTDHVNVLIEEIEALEWNDSYKFLYGISNRMDDLLSEKKQAVLANKIGESIKSLSKYKILAGGIKKVKDIADNLFDTDDEEYANILYDAVINLAQGKGLLSQFIQAKVVETAEERGIELSEEHLTVIIDSIETWIAEGLKDAVDVGLDYYKEKIQFDGLKEAITLSKEGAQQEDEPVNQQ